MAKRPNILWIMSDQHNARCTGYRNHPNVKTPNLNRIAANGIDFTHAYANNPICSPSRICFMTGQYVHTHGFSGNYNFDHPAANPNTFAVQLRKYGYQTAIIGKAHMIKRWDDDGFEFIRYCDLADSEKGDPTTNHYFRYLDDLGLGDYYEEGTPKPGQQYTLDGSSPAQLPYEHSIERFTGRETLKFLEERDESRPFFVQMSFQRPHAPISPAAEHFGMYDPEQIELPSSSVDYLERRFAGKPSFLRQKLANGCEYPLADPDPYRLKKCLASYYALISVIDSEIGKVLDWLDSSGELENTIVLYVADHGDFAGEHGLFHKNFGIYESIQNIPFLLSYPGGPKGISSGIMVESIDLYSTLCALCRVPVPAGVEGVNLVPALEGASASKSAAYCEWSFQGRKITAIRTEHYRLVYYQGEAEGELYDHRDDPGEMDNLWNAPAYKDCKLELLQSLLTFTMDYAVTTSTVTDSRNKRRDRHTPSVLLHSGKKYWSKLKEVYSQPDRWPPK